MTVVLHPIADRVHLLAIGLRRAGIEVSTGELLDAIEALGYLDLADRGTLRAGLRAAMTKDVVASKAFDDLFDRCFRPTASDLDDDHNGHSHVVPVDAPTTAPRPSRALSEEVLAALRAGDVDQLKLLASEAVDLFAGLGASPEGATERYFLHRVMRAIDLSRMLSAAMQQIRKEGALSEFEVGLERNELTRLIEEFRKALAAEIAARITPLDDVDIAGRTDPADKDIVRLSPLELHELRRTIQPLARQLAARIGRKRKLRVTGRLDVRRTVRRSLQTGGVPMDVVNRRRHPHKPDIVLLCDVSGSVAEFAQFTFTLVNAVHDELRNVRSFAFVDGIAEVTDLFAEADYAIHVARFVERRGVVRLDGHSDYGSVFRHFNDRYLSDAIGPRTTVIITGDARGNYRDGHPDALALIAARARKVFWLNPEPSAAWGTDDSLVNDYRPMCQSIFEVRSLRQLATAIADIV